MKSKLRNCPPEFYGNCLNAQVKCNQCVAGSGNTALHYLPYLNLEDKPHPEDNWQQKKQQRRKIQRQATHTEETISNRLNKRIVDKTFRSGAANHDGDLSLSLDTDNIRIEVKRRGVRKSWNVTLTEFDKGIKQGIDVFAIEIERPDTKDRQTLYCCTEDIFTSLVSAKLNTTELTGE